LRNIRSSYGARHPVKVGKTSNGRMSEAQAAIGLMSLADFSVNRDNNERLHTLYQKGMAGVPGVEVVMPEGTDRSNFQYAVFRIDATAFGMPRDHLIDTLEAENVIARRYFHPGLHKSLPWKESHPEFFQKLPVTDVLCTQFMQLPLGAQTTDSVIASICDLVRAIQRQAAAIRPSQER
jgi:dTDP-4-amino-4,6-dideoxygalactose transaminase